MKQSRKMSFVESVASTSVGFGINLYAQTVIFPAFGVHLQLHDNLLIASIFTVISIARGFLLRRVFEAVRIWTQRRIQ